PPGVTYHQSFGSASSQYLRSHQLQNSERRWPHEKADWVLSGSVWRGWFFHFFQWPSSRHAVDWTVTVSARFKSPLKRPIFVPIFVSETPVAKTTGTIWSRRTEHWVLFVGATLG